MTEVAAAPLSPTAAPIVRVLAVLYWWTIRSAAAAPVPAASGPPVICTLPPTVGATRMPPEAMLAPAGSTATFPAPGPNRRLFVSVAPADGVASPPAGTSVFSPDPQLGE